MAEQGGLRRRCRARLRPRGDISRIRLASGKKCHTIPDDPPHTAALHATPWKNECRRRSGPISGRAPSVSGLRRPRCGAGSIRGIALARCLIAKSTKHDHRKGWQKRPHQRTPRSDCYPAHDNICKPQERTASFDGAAPQDLATIGAESACNRPPGRFMGSRAKFHSSGIQPGLSEIAD